MAFVLGAHQDTGAMILIRRYCKLSLSKWDDQRCYRDVRWRMKQKLSDLLLPNQVLLFVAGEGRIQCLDDNM